MFRPSCAFAFFGTSCPVADAHRLSRTDLTSSPGGVTPITIGFRLQNLDSILYTVFPFRFLQMKKPKMNMGSQASTLTEFRMVGLEKSIQVK